MTIRLLMAFSILAALLTASPAVAQSDAAQAVVEAWIASPHARADSESFTHWDEEGEIPVACATCHSGEGFRDFIGVDGTPGIEHPIALGSVVDCETCHNPVAENMSSVTFPSGEIVGDLESEAICMTCHQGRETGVNVDAAVADAAPDEVNPELGFINVHYAIAGATQLGAVVHGGYEYDGKTYMGRFEHVPPFSTCIECHNPHTLEVEVAQCTSCHSVEELSAIRTSAADFDADGDVTEGIRAEIMSLHEKLDEAIRVYSAEVVEAPIVYASAYPYYFADTNGDGTAGPDEAIFPNSYKSWTPRLLKAAYNYQFVKEDPGAYAHNPHYALQILYDSIESLAEVTSIDLGDLQRP